jgi:hypothetical protein
MVAFLGIRGTNDERRMSGAGDGARLVSCEKVARHEAKVAEERIHALLLQAERLERALEKCVSRGYGWWW